jgi:hypothetical protein
VLKSARRCSSEVSSLEASYDRRRAMIAVAMYTTRRANIIIVFDCIVVVGDLILCAEKVGKCDGMVWSDSRCYLYSF